jgi:N-acetylglutamate synthase-like GNAT family acetyltransferase
MGAGRLRATPLAAFEREGLAAALRNCGLPTDDLNQAGHLFWRFETPSDIPVGFGGLELHSRDGLLRSIVILPPLRRQGFGSAIVAALELEARALGCRTVYLLTTAPPFFARSGYLVCEPDDVPQAVRASVQMANDARANAGVMVKRLD